jgi:asparagine synthase (glutamine-hydrolysing)
MDEPVADPTALPIYLLSKLSKKYVTVILEGEGSDETLAGYEHYKIMRIANSYLPYTPMFIKRNIMPSMMKFIPKEILDKFFSYSSALGEEGEKRMYELLLKHQDHAESYMILNSIFSEKEKSEMYINLPAKKLKNGIEVVRPYFPDNSNNFNILLNQMLNCDINTFLKHLLLKTDKTTMASSIEARVPFLDKELVEFSAQLPPKLKLNGSIDKYILRKSMNKKIPDFILKRKKQRFFVPIHIWFKNAFKENFINMFTDATFKKRGLLDYKYINKIISNFDKSKLYYGRQVWSLLNLELWFRIFLDQDDISKPNLKIENLVD